MTTHIEHAVTEVIAEPEFSETGEPGDQRWSEQDKVMAAQARRLRIKQRISAEGFDD